MADTDNNLDIYDSEILEIEKVLEVLQYKASTKKQNYESFQNEIKNRFAEIGFVVDVLWYEVGEEMPDGTVRKQEDVFMPEIVIKNRVQRIEFDRERMRHEVVNNILEMPDQTKGELIKATPEDLQKLLLGHEHKH